MLRIVALCRPLEVKIRRGEIIGFTLGLRMRELVGVATATMSILAVSFFATGSAFAQASSAPTDLVGRNGQFTVTDNSGKVETIDPKQLSLQRELLPSAPRAAITDAENQTGPGEKSTPKAPGAKVGTAANATAIAAKEETPEEKAVRAADVEELRAMRKQGGAYFYTEDNKPVPFDEIDRRIETGEVEGLKAVGLHLQDWKPLTKSKTSATSGPAPAPATTQESEPREQKKY